MSALKSSRMQIVAPMKPVKEYNLKNPYSWKPWILLFSNEIKKFHTHVLCMNFRQDLNEAIWRLWPLGLREQTDSLRVNRAPNQFSWPQPSQGSMFYFLCSFFFYQLLTSFHCMYAFFHAMRILSYLDFALTIW